LVPAFALRATAGEPAHNPRHILSVMRGHSRSKNGVLSHAYDPRIHEEARRTQTLRPCMPSGLMDCRVKPGNDH
jgi:hypothetical protein